MSWWVVRWSWAWSRCSRARAAAEAARAASPVVSQPSPDGIWKIVKAVNDRTAVDIDESMLHDLFKLRWNDLRTAVGAAINDAVINDPANESPERGTLRSFSTTWFRLCASFDKNSGLAMAHSVGGNQSTIQLCIRKSKICCVRQVSRRRT